MGDEVLLTVDGEVDRCIRLSYTDLEQIGEPSQVRDVSRIDASRRGDAVTLDSVLALAGPKPSGDYLTLHASADDFHASIPLEVVRREALLVYRLDGAPLPSNKGGPVRLLIPESAACHTAEVDDCANVKFVDRIEITRGRGEDTRPTTDDEHEEVHRREKMD